MQQSKPALDSNRPTRALVASVSFALLTAGCVATTGPKTGAGADGTDPNYDANGKPKAVQVRQTERGVQLTSDERVLFDIGKADIKPEGMVYIERVATILKTKTQANAMVEGHTDNVGGAALNQQLSVRRANAVKDAIVKQGVSVARIQAQGFGLSKPIADNATPEGRQTNRRTDIFVLGETVEKIAGPGGSASLADSLSAGLDKFLKNVGQFFNNVFGSGNSGGSAPAQ
jgi:outer membrane protein OmpA-like peptidoglycan-associated protein